MEGTMDVSLVDAVTDKLCKVHPGATSTAEDGEGGAPCTIAPMHPPGSQLDIFRVGTILRAAGLDLDGASFGNEHRWVISAWATNEAHCSLPPRDLPQQHVRVYEWLNFSY
jgi:hypothetical protein